LTGTHKHELFLSGEAVVSKILTTKELAEYLKLTEVTGFKIGSRWRFDKDKIDDLLKCEESDVIKQT
jgi:hypothetical protein